MLFAAFLEPGAAPSAQGTPVTGGCAGGALGPAHDQPGVVCEDFDTDRNGSGALEWTRLFPGTYNACDRYRAFPDPNDDVIGHSIGGGTPIPLGVAGRICSEPVLWVGDIGCEGPVRTENDWHLHSPSEGCDTDDSFDLGDPNFATSCAPSPRAHSGTRSLHLGRHLRAADPDWDTYRLRQTSAFVLDPVTPGPASTLEFWQIIQVCDDLCVSVQPAKTTAGGQVQVSLRDQVLGVFGPWERLDPVENGYGATVQDTIAVCQFDPGDDLLPPINETMCLDDSPLWSKQGDPVGADVTCTADTDGNDPNNLDCGRTDNRTVDPNCSWVADPNCGSYLENGSTGPGVWARSRFDLSPFAGRQARLRWAFEAGGGWGFGESRSFLEPEPGFTPYIVGTRDDGWYVDDIRLTDIRESEPACIDGDGDGYGSPGSPVCSQGPEPDCGCLEPTVHPAAPEICDQLDNDCDGIYQPDEIDMDGDNVAPCQGDCDDTLRSSISTPAPVAIDQIYPYSGEWRFSWVNQRPTAGNGIVYDVWYGLLSGLQGAQGLASGDCASDSQSSWWFDLPAADPPPGDGFYWVVRGQNGCPVGDGTWGSPLRDAQIPASPEACD